MSTTHILSCDWGTSRFRLRLATVPEGQVLAEVANDDGVGRIAAETAPAARDARYRQQLAAALAALAARTDVPLDGLPLYVSGMAGSSIGWREVPYASIPFPLAGSRVNHVALPPLTHATGSNPITIFGGLACGDDVMRGEETEAAGLARLLDLCAGVLILPGTHSKHLYIDDHHVVQFTTHMTGELYAVLRAHTVLRHSLGPDDTTDMDAFREGLDCAARLPLAAALFKLRTRQLLHGAARESGSGFLSGLLIGAEICHVRSSQPPGGGHLILGAGSRLAPLYAEACRCLLWGVRVLALPPAQVDGLTALGHVAFHTHAIKDPHP